MYNYCVVTVIFFTTLLAMTAGCTTTRPQHPPSASQETPQSSKPGDIIEAHSGKKISFEDLINDLAGVRVIYVGETHTSVEDHQIQQKIMEALYEKNPTLILAMEMFPREVQPVLDQWSTGLLQEKPFRRESRWAENWGFPFQFYRSLLTGAKDKRMKVLALNAPGKIVGKIAQSGLSSLTPEERGQIARDFDLKNARHRELVREQYEQHPEGNFKDFESFYEAQLAWEETMAETLAQELSTHRGQEQILVVIGSGHVAYGLGVPERTGRRFRHSYRIILPLPARSMKEPVDPELADILWVTEGKKFAHPPRGRLGVMIRPASSGEGFEVIEVVPGSPAAKAGVQKGDVLYGINGKAIESIEDLHEELASKETKPVQQLGIRRGTKEISVEVTLP